MNYPILTHYETSLYPFWKHVGTAEVRGGTLGHTSPWTYLEMAVLCSYEPFGFAHISKDDILSSLRRGVGDLGKNSHLFWKQVNAGKLPTWRSNVVLIVLHSIESSAHILNYIRQYNNSLQLVCLSSGRASQTSHRCRSLFHCHWDATTSVASLQIWIRTAASDSHPPRNPCQDAKKLDFGIQMVPTACIPQI